MSTFRCIKTEDFNKIMPFLYEIPYKFSFQIIPLLNKAPERDFQEEEKDSEKS